MNIDFDSLMLFIFRVSVVGLAFWVISGLISAAILHSPTETRNRKEKDTKSPSEDLLGTEGVYYLELSSTPSTMSLSGADEVNWSIRDGLPHSAKQMASVLKVMNIPVQGLNECLYCGMDRDMPKGPCNHCGGPK